MDDFVKMLELKLEHAATPERVAKATRLLADLLEPLVPGDQPESERNTLHSDPGRPPVTVVVSNFTTSAAVRVWDQRVAPKVQVLVDFIANPEAPIEGEFTPLFAERIAKYAREEWQYQPSFWVENYRLRSVNETYANQLEAAVRQKRRRPQKFLGATFITTPILGIRVAKNDAATYHARLVLPGGKESGDEVLVAPNVCAKFSAAFERGRETRQQFRVKLVGNWTRKGSRLEFTINDKDKLRATGIDDRIMRSNGPALLAEMDADPIIKREEMQGILRQVRGGGEDDE